MEHALKLYTDGVLTITHIVDGKPPVPLPPVFNPQTGKESSSPHAFNADLWQHATTAYIKTASNLLPSSWPKIFEGAKAVLKKTWSQRGAESQVIDLTIDEPEDECAMLVDIPDSDDEDAQPVMVKNEDEDIMKSTLAMDLDLRMGMMKMWRWLPIHLVSDIYFFHSSS